MTAIEWRMGAGALSGAVLGGLFVAVGDLVIGVWALALLCIGGTIASIYCLRRWLGQEG